MGVRQIVLIGPAAVGKSTVGAELARLLGRPFVDLDEIAGVYYAEVGQPVERLVERIALPWAGRWHARRLGAQRAEPRPGDDRGAGRRTDARRDRR